MQWSDEGYLLSKNNFDVAKSFALEAETKFATNKDRFTKYFSKIE